MPTPATNSVRDGHVTPGSADRYEIVRRLGSGSTATVSLARDHGAGGSMVAIKKATGEARDELLREFRILTTARHPLLPHAIDLLQGENETRLILDVVDGETLEQRISNAPLHDSVELARLAACLLSAIDRLHGERYLHLDIKPSNIMVGGHGRQFTATVIDVGMGLSFSEASEAGRAGGTPAFAAPEARAGVPVDLRADLYSIGRTIRVAAGSAALPEWLRSLCSRLDDPDPRARYASAEEAARAHVQVAEALANELPFRLPYMVNAGQGTLVQDRLRAGTAVLLTAPKDRGKTRFLRRLQRDFTLRGTPTFWLSGLDPTGTLTSLRAAFGASEPDAGGPHSSLNADPFDVATTAIARARAGTLFLVDDAEKADPRVIDALLAAARGALSDDPATPRPAVVLAVDRIPSSGPLASAEDWIHHESPSTREIADSLRRASAATIPSATLREAAERLNRAAEGAVSAIEDRIGAAVLAAGSWTTAMDHLVRHPLVASDAGRRNTRRKAFSALTKEGQELIEIAARAQIPLSMPDLVRATGRPEEPTVSAIANLRLCDAFQRLQNGRFLLSERFAPPPPSEDRARQLSSMVASGIRPSGDRELDAVRAIHRLLARPNPEADREAARALERLRSSGASRLVSTLARPVAREMARELARVGSKNRDNQRSPTSDLTGSEPKGGADTGDRSLAPEHGDSEGRLGSGHAGETWQPTEVVVELGRALLDIGQAKDGERLLQSILNDDGSTQAALASRARAALGLAEGASRHGDLKEARKHAQAAARLIKQVDNPVLQAQIANMEAWLLYLQGDYERARQRAKAELPDVRGKVEEALLLNLCGLANLGEGRFDDASQSLRAALLGFTQQGVSTGVAMARNNLALVASRAGKLPAAARQLAILRREARVNHQPRRAALAANNAAIIYRDFGHLNRARSLAGEAVRVREATHDRYALASSLSNRSTILTELGDAASAIQDAEQSAEEFVEAGASNEEVTARKNIVRTRVALGDDSRAKEEIQHALTLARRRKLSKEVADLLGLDSRRLARNGEIQEAVRQLKSAVELHLERGDMRSAFLLDVEVCCQGDEFLSAMDTEDRQAMLTRSRDERLLRSFETGGLRQLVTTRIHAIEGRAALATTAFYDVFRSLSRCERPRILFVAATLAAEDAVAADRTIAASRAISVAIDAHDRLRNNAPGQLDPSITARFTKVSTQQDVADTQEFRGPAQFSSMRRGSLDRVLELYRQLALASDVEPLLDAILDASLSLVGAARAFLLVVGDEDGTTVARSRDTDGRLENPDDQLSRSILETAIRTGQRLVVGDAAIDPHWSEFLSVKRLRLRSVACLPLRAGDRTIGALYVDHANRSQAFDPEDLDLLERFADQASLALVRIRDARRIQELNTVLEQRLVRTERALAAAEQSTRMGDRLRPMQRLIGSSPEMTRVRRDLERCAVSDLPLLVVGESGTGKNLVARAVHDASPRNTGPFVVLDGATISDPLFEAEVFGALKGSFTGAIHDRIGLFAEADGGTLFLDHVDQLTPASQARLLRALETGIVRPIGGEPRRFDVRIVAASSSDLRAGIESNANSAPLREDLYFRLKGVEVTLPPLRRRGNDILELAELFLSEEPPPEDASTRSLRASARKTLLAYGWPGNVRELRSEIARLSLSPASSIGSKDLKPEFRTPRAAGKKKTPDRFDAQSRVRETERQTLEQALNETQGNRTQAAALLGLSRQGLLKKMKRLGIQ